MKSYGKTKGSNALKKAALSLAALRDKNVFIIHTSEAVVEKPWQATEFCANGAQGSARHHVSAASRRGYNEEITIYLMMIAV